MKLLEDVLIIDFSQFLSGPSASLRLADMGARVIKIEKIGTGDICRKLYVSDVHIDGDSTIFHAINRNKESVEINLKDDQHKEEILKLIAKADVVMHNFRPGVMKRNGLCYETIKKIKPSIVYAEISGYGETGPWSGLPGQDLLLQSLTGIPNLNGERNKNPTSMGVSVVDMLSGAHLVQGILAALYKKDQTAEGSLVQVSMLESAMDFQFEVFTTFLNDGLDLPKRSNQNHAHAYVGAPYGIFQTEDGYLALAMGSIPKLQQLLGCNKLSLFHDSKIWFKQRDPIKKILANHLLKNTTQFWLNILEPADIWCAKVLNLPEILQEEGYQVLDMEMTVKTSKGYEVKTTRCPFTINGEKLTSYKGAPFLGEHNDAIAKEFGLYI